MQDWQVIIGEVHVPDALRNFYAFFEDPVEAALDDIAKETVTLYQSFIEEVGAVSSGDFRDTVRVREVSLGERIVASDVAYSGVVEYGWINRARGQESYPGRHPAQMTVDALDSVVHDAFETQFIRAGWF